MKVAKWQGSKASTLIVGLSFILTGCTVRTYSLTKDRIDQDLTAGNRGFIQGQAPAGETAERKTTRTTQVVEVEFRPLIKFEKAPKPKPVEVAPAVEIAEEPELMGNRGFITQSETPEISEPQLVQYKVEKGDTLQKISKKFYGTTKKWAKIYEANKDTLKGPDRVYPGQVISIPVSGETRLKEIPANLK